MEQPSGFSDTSGRVCRLKKSLYGLRQAADVWHGKVLELIVKLGYQKSRSDPCLFLRKDDNRSHPVWIWLYVDDMLMFSAAGRDTIMNELSAVYKMKDLGEAKFALGVRLLKNDSGELHLSQEALARELLKKYLPDKANAASTPLPTSVECSEDTLLDDVERSMYRSITGIIVYLSVVTRPDLCVAHSVLGSQLSKPKRSDMVRAVHYMCYIKGKPDHGIVYTRGKEKDLGVLADLLEVYSDADYANAVNPKRRSRSGVQINLAGCAIDWKGVLQKTTALSTTEAELYALVEAV